MITEIDWSKAPEGAGYYPRPYFYKVENETAYFWDENYEDWRESSYYPSHVERFTSRPVSANQKVSTEVEAASTEIKHYLGLTSKNIWEEQMQHQRRQDIHAAMQRYIEAGKEIPNDWLYELMGLNNTLAGIETDFDEAIRSLPVKDGGEWIEWGKNEVPEGLEGYTIEREYTDGEYRKGRVGEYTWNDGYYIIDCDTVKRYRIIQE